MLNVIMCLLGTEIHWAAEREHGQNVEACWGPTKGSGRSGRKTVPAAETADH